MAVDPNVLDAPLLTRTAVVPSRVPHTEHRAGRPEPWLAEAGPAFLELLKRDPKRAFAEFHRYGWDFLDRRRPMLLRRMSREDRHEVIAETLFRCVDKEQALLRSYDERVPFPHWLAMQANSVARAHARKEETLRRRWGRNPGDPELDELPDSGPAAERRFRIDALYRSTASCFERLGDFCKKLLIGTANGLKPRELAVELGRPPEHARAIARHLSWCRGRLGQLLRADGVEYELPE